MEGLVSKNSKEKVELLKEYVKENNIIIMNLTESLPTQVLCLFAKYLPLFLTKQSKQKFLVFFSNVKLVKMFIKL